MAKNDKQVQEYLDKGWVVLNEGKSFITLKKPKKFNWGWFIIWTLFGLFFGGIFYLIYYGVKSEKTITLQK